MFPNRSADDGGRRIVDGDRPGYDDDRSAPCGAPLVSDGGLAIREPPVILVPIEVLEGQTIPETLVEFLAPAEVVVLGYHVLPEQTPTEQASLQFEDRAQEAVDDIARTFVDAGRDPETRVVFTHDREQTIDRVASEVGATAILLPNPTGEVDSVLVPIRGVVDDDRLADLVATLVSEDRERVTLWGLTPDESDFDPDRAVERAAERLRDRGIPDAQITREATETNTPIIDIVDRSGEAGVIVMGEGRESLVSVFLGEDTERVAEGAVAPVLVVRDREPDEIEDGAADDAEHGTSDDAEDGAADDAEHGAADGDEDSASKNAETGAPEAGSTGPDSSR
ncbi:universal stress protein [Halobellus limi]|uniref:Universal stress protein n=1 Tax=Halobellus limi TaxID=699433 RepID=A0A1H5WL38_9EURY|nr:universal stress protein [Halobellus limi]QCC46426.1 universal stress protein [Halobellus limi]SEF99657.1 Universal stress protein family protein [Halobellus limi]